MDESLDVADKYIRFQVTRQGYLLQERSSAQTRPGSIEIKKAPLKDLSQNKRAVWKHNSSQKPPKSPVNWVGVDRVVQTCRAREKTIDFSMEWNG